MKKGDLAMSWIGQPKSFHHIAVSLLLTAIIFGLIVQAVPRTALSETETSASTNKTCQEPQNRDKVEILKGEAAKLRALQLRARNKAFDRAMKDMERIGKRVRWDLSAVVLRGEKAIAQAKSSTQANSADLPELLTASYSRPQATISGAEGEMTFITYDGPEHTWEGTVYAHDYSDGQTHVYNGAIFDYYSEDPINWQVTDEIYYPPDGSGGIRTEPCGNGPCLEIEAARFFGQSEGRLLKASYGKLPYSPMAARPVWNFLRRFFACFFRSFGVAVRQQCPGAPRFMYCLLTSAGSAAICCGIWTGPRGQSGQGHCY